METTEVGHCPPGEGTEVDLELDDVPMDGADDDFVTAPIAQLVNPSICSFRPSLY